MLKIGEFSKLSMLTVKALRFYEKEGLLVPAKVDEWSGYRFYETAQLGTAASIKALRQLGFSVEETKAYLEGAPLTEALSRKREELILKQSDISTQLSIIRYLMEDTTPTRVHQRLSQNNLRKRQISCETTAELSK